ncbi:alginate export family protein [Rhodonellum sp.]|uniref:alginate export family protein n=1 Tax=Rhodonellum sp. TaxID=2231180 RepID=UPI0027241FF3|nr:alginate export family protein [Rhodonellum sp.]MDO9551082.1 alginate export family protein [Rhodonellum sp.]
MYKKILFGWGLLMVLSSTISHAQFNLDGQLIQRAEYRHGFNRLFPEGDKPAGFIAHRARLQASYKMESFDFYMSIQDIRTWGNTPQVKATDNFLSVHEAWVEAKLSQNWKVKLGRQELNYDNARFLGNLDWALQGRAHDFALVKYEKENLKFHFGGGFNQDAQMLTGNIFTVPNQYKAAQMARVENKWGDFHFSTLIWNDGRQYVTTNAAGEILDEGIRYQQTIGLPTLRYPIGNTTLSAFYYHQLGTDVAGRNVNGFDLSAQVTHQITGAAQTDKRLRLTAGFEILSGTSNNDLSKNRSFSPLYGTNHLFNGYMDLFYVGGTHETNVGLQDYFLRSRYDFGPRFFLQTDGHLFYSQADVYRANGAGEKMDKFFGTELDLSLGFILNDAISIQGGYSQFFHTDTFEMIQKRGALSDNQNWAYLMLIFRPTMKNKFIGILL